MSFEAVDSSELVSPPVGVDRIWFDSRGQVLAELEGKYGEDGASKAVALLEDGEFKKEATAKWSDLLKDCENPEKKEEELIKGLVAKIGEKLGRVEERE